MNAVCPSCGVTVMEGYVRCPKCHAGLPLAGRAGRGSRSTIDPGGTAVARKGFPIAALAVAVGVVAVFILVFGLRGRGTKTEPVAPPPPIAAVPSPPTATPAPTLRPAPAVDIPNTTAQDQRAATAELETALRMQRLWGRVEITGTRVDVRSGSCSDRGMHPLIDSKRAVLHGAGLTRLRCVEQSGGVVFEHDL